MDDCALMMSWSCHAFRAQHAGILCLPPCCVLDMRFWLLAHLHAVKMRSFPELLSYCDIKTFQVRSTSKRVVDMTMYVE